MAGEQVDGETEWIPNREGTRSGQTMFADYLLFYCGASYVHPTDKGSNDNALLQRGSMMVMQLNATYLEPTCEPTYEPTLEPTVRPTGGGGDGAGLKQGEIIGLVIGLFFVAMFMAAAVFWFMHSNADSSSGSYGAVPATEIAAHAS